MFDFYFIHKTPQGFFQYKAILEKKILRVCIKKIISIGKLRVKRMKERNGRNCSV